LKLGQGLGRGWGRGKVGRVEVEVEGGQGILIQLALPKL